MASNGICLNRFTFYPLLPVLLGIGAASPSAISQPVEVIKSVRADKIDAETLTPNEKKRTKEAIDRGVAFLRRTQLPSGSWAIGSANRKNSMGTFPGLWPVGYAALPALTLLECGAPAGDDAVHRAARFVRAEIPTMTKTYEISLAVLLLHRLGNEKDRPLIRTLGLRLAAAQGRLGGWGYNCPILTPAQEKTLAEMLRQRGAKAANNEPFSRPKKGSKSVLLERNTDNSNTQFAILALWVARKYDLPLEYTLARIEKRFRVTQGTKGWGYGSYGGGAGAMTCVGLLGLAVGRASAPEMPKEAEDEAITQGLKALGFYMKDPTNDRSPISIYGPRGTLNYYFLWSVERVGVLYNLKTIGGNDWYRWGLEVLLPAQKRDGSWLGRGNGGSPVIDTSMALLFLKRSDLLPDLRETLQKRLKITDPGLDKAISPKKSPGEKSDPKRGRDKKSPGEKNDLKNGIEKKTPPEKSALSMPQLSPWQSPFPRRCWMNIPQETAAADAKRVWQDPANWLEPDGKHRAPEVTQIVRFRLGKLPVQEETQEQKHLGTLL